MPLYRETGVSVGSWVDMAADVTARHEVDPLNDRATLFFGTQDDYVLCMPRENLVSFIDEATKAVAELDAHRAPAR